MARRRIGVTRIDQQVAEAVSCHATPAIERPSRVLTWAADAVARGLEAPFQNAFASLTSHEKAIEVAVLYIMVSLSLLIAPSARHRILGQDEATAGCFPSRSRLRSILSSPVRGCQALGSAPRPVPSAGSSRSDSCTGR
jgi:hypothetical protein